MTGLVRFGVRDYDPQTGRWTARDPALFDGGQPNFYAYVNGDPVNGRDPTGLGDGPMYPANPSRPPQPNVCGPSPEQRKAELWQLRLRYLKASDRAVKSDDPKDFRDSQKAFRDWQREYWRVNPNVTTGDGKPTNGAAFPSYGVGTKA